MTGDFAVKSRRNYFATKLCLVFTWNSFDAVMENKADFLLSNVSISLKILQNLMIRTRNISYLCFLKSNINEIRLKTQNVRIKEN